MTGVGDFLASNQDEPIEFPDGQSSYVHNVILDDDDIYELSGTVTLTLLADSVDPATYAVAAAPANKASVVINDNEDIPEISVVPVSPMVVEGADIQFRIQASRATSIVYDNQATAADPDANLRVNLSISGQVNEFVQIDHSSDSGARLQNYVEIPSGETEVILVIPTVDDQIDDLDGRISVTVLPAKFTQDIQSRNNVGNQPNERISVTTFPDYFYQIDEDFPTASVNIFDNDFPVLTIASGNPIREGETAIFSLTLDPAPHIPFPVFVRVNQTNGNFFEQQNDLISVQLSRHGTGTLEIPTMDDNKDELDGQIIATLIQDNESPPRYQIGNIQPGSLPTGYTAAVEIADNDPNLPRVSISTTATSVVEGTSFAVSLQANSALSSNSSIIVGLDVRDSGLGTGYLGNYSPNPVTLTGTSVTNVTINTLGDLLDEDDGQITVTVNDGTNYTAGENNSISVTVTDDDDVDLPEVSISTETTRITEGDSVDFIVIMTPAPALGTSQDITLEIVETVQVSNFFNQISPSQITIDHIGRATGRILTNDDDEADTSGRIIISVLGVASEYRPASIPNNSINFEVFR